MSEQRTPGEDDVRRVYVYAMRAHGYPQGQPDAEFDRFIARVRRDAAREALEGYADVEEDSFLALHVKGAPISAAQCAHAAMTAREYHDTHYPEQEGHDGSIGWLYTHHSLDGREHKEGK